MIRDVGDTVLIKELYQKQSEVTARNRLMLNELRTVLTEHTSFIESLISSKGYKLDSEGQFN